MKRGIDQAEKRGRALILDSGVSVDRPLRCWAGKRPGTVDFLSGPFELEQVR